MPTEPGMDGELSIEELNPQSRLTPARPVLVQTLLAPAVRHRSSISVANGFERGSAGLKPLTGTTSGKNMKYRKSRFFWD